MGPVGEDMSLLSTPSSLVIVEGLRRWNRCAQLLGRGLFFVSAEAVPRLLITLRLPVLYLGLGMVSHLPLHLDCPCRQGRVPPWISV